MAVFSEDRVLVTVEINVQTQTVNIAWANRVLRDGEVISSIPHRGAYPVDDDGEIVAPGTDIGLKLTELLGEAGAYAQSQLAGALQRIDELEAELASKNV